MSVQAPRLLVAVVLLSGCASVVPLDSQVRAPVPPPTIRFGVDTFAFPNESRAKNEEKPDLYANYCFVMARAITQFQRFARFDPAGPRLSAQAYTERVAQVIERSPWHEPLPADERVVIPGYAGLYDFSKEEEGAVKAGLTGRFWTLVHWTNWRVVFPFPGWHQERVASQAMSELLDGRSVQLLVTNFPSRWELNHTVVAFDYQITHDGSVEFAVYDPNDPYVPGRIGFDRRRQRFVATQLFDTTVGPIRAFRMYYWPLL